MEQDTKEISDFNFLSYQKIKYICSIIVFVISYINLEQFAKEDVDYIPIVALSLFCIANIVLDKLKEKINSNAFVSF